MPQKKQIIDIFIEPSNECKCPVPHLVSLTYNDKTKVEISMNSFQLADVLSKQYIGFKESVDLIISGSTYVGFTFKAGAFYFGTLNIKDVLALFNQSDYVNALVQKQASLEKNSDNPNKTTDHSNNIDRSIKNIESRKPYSCCRLFSNRAVLATALTVTAEVAVVIAVAAKACAN